jgi:NAD+ synthetase
VKIALGQINPTVGDFEGNLSLIETALEVAEAASADLLVLPELALCGYPPRDLLERPAFLRSAAQALGRLVARVRTTAVVVGFAEGPEGARGRPAWNSAAVIDDGRVVAVARKRLLPTYDVFDEDRYFAVGDGVVLAPVRGRRMGVSICEDAWNDASFWPHPRYATDPLQDLVDNGADVIVNVAASPFDLSKRHQRPRMLAHSARRHGRPLVFVNQVGGHDDLVFDGSSAIFDAQGALLACGAELGPDLVIADLDQPGASASVEPPASDARAALDALTLGVRDYVRRCGFSRVLLGLSGGIDSAVVACIAARALGPANVLGVALPSRYSSPGSIEDARALATNLGIRFETLPIEAAFQAFLNTLAPSFAGSPEDVTEENIQARVRGVLLMALANKRGDMLMTTGNKSELATGYCTLYGDMAGGFAVLSDVMKTLVYRIAREINVERALIPQSTMDKAPSAELRPGQKDEDTLPPYAVLDPILEAHLEQNLDGAGLIERGHDPQVVEDVLRRVRLSEHKRRQMPPGPKITPKAFGSGRRFPIAQGWRG